jgi:excisionase family DNA binding protein
MEQNKFYQLLQEMLACMESSKPVKQVMNVDELSKYTGFSKSYIYRLSSQRVIPHYKPVGKTLFFKKREIDFFLANNPMPTIEFMNQMHQKSLAKAKQKQT